MKYLIVLLSLGLHVFAGDRKGNGGDVLICDNNSPYQLWSLDQYEALHRYSLQSKIPKTTSDIQASKQVLRRIAKFSPRRYQRLTSLVESFYEKVKFVEFPLGEVHDSGSFEIPGNCKLYQVINQNTGILPNSKFYLIEKNTWAKLSYETRVSLILHEVLYKDQNFETSETLRQYNAFLMADSFSQISFYDYLNYIKRLGFISNSVGPVLVDLEQPLALYPNLSLKYGSVLENSLYFHSSFPRLKLYGDRVYLYQNGIPQSFCPKAHYTMSWNQLDFAMFCWNSLGEKIPLKFYESGRFHSGATAYKEIQRGPYRIFLGSLFDGVKIHGALALHENGNLKQVQNSRVHYRQGIWDLKFAGNRPVRFYSNEFLSTGWLEFGSRIKVDGKDFQLEGFIEFYSNASPKRIHINEAMPIEVGSRNFLAQGNSEVLFYPNFQVASMVSQEDLKLKDRNGNLRYIKKGVRLYFDKNGGLK